MKRSYLSWFIVFLSQQKGIGWHTINLLLQHDLLQSAKWDHNVLQAYIKSRDRIEALLISKECFNEQVIIKMQEDEQRFGYESILWNESDYPAILRECVQAPWVIYIKGRKQLLHAPMVSIVGTRAPSTYGMAITKKVSAELSALGLTIVSGLALGIDTVAHEQSMRGIGSTIAVLPSGIKHCYPRQNKQLYEKISIDGLLLSEYVGNETVHKGLFSARNRIIAGLSHATIVVEGERKSGSMITAKFAQEMDRELYAVPGSLFSNKSEGPNYLIYKNHARLLLRTSQLFDDLPWLATDVKQFYQVEEDSTHKDQLRQNEKIKGNLSTEENIVLNHILTEPATLDDLMHRTSYSYVQLSVILVQLSVKNYIKIHHGSLYIAL